MAEEQGLAPQEYADGSSRRGGRSPPVGVVDFFIRTSDDGHKRFVQQFLERIRANGRDDIYQDVYAGLYCVGCEAFKSEEELVDGTCPEHDVEPEWIEERNWFFRLSAYQDRLLALYDEQTDFVLPAFRANEARSFIAGGLQDFSISREGLSWGFRSRGTPPGRLRVGRRARQLPERVDVRAAGRGHDPAVLPAVRHLLAKDILRFLRLLAGDAAGGGVRRAAPAVRPRLPAAERPGRSRSPRERRRPARADRRLRRDAVRFWCARSVSFGQDGVASIEAVRERYDRELGNDLATCSRARRRWSPALSRWDALRRLVGGLRGGDLALLLGLDVAARLDAFDLTSALERIWEVVRGLNRHVEARPGLERRRRSEELDRVLYDLVDGLRAVAVALAAYLPETSALLAALRQPATLDWSEVACGRARAAGGRACGTRSSRASTSRPWPREPGRGALLSLRAAPRSARGEVSPCPSESSSRSRGRMRTARATSVTSRASACLRTCSPLPPPEGNDVLMVSGTDEHGTPIMVAADRRSEPAGARRPTTRSFSEDRRRLGLSYDLFRTTTENHHRVVRDVFRTLYERDFLVERTMMGAFSAATGRTLPTATSRARARSADFRRHAATSATTAGTSSIRRI